MAAEAAVKPSTSPAAAAAAAAAVAASPSLIPKTSLVNSYDQAVAVQMTVATPLRPLVVSVEWEED